jgi:hypothetical protein
MAAPHVAGAWAILRQAKPSASVSQLLTALQSTGVSISGCGGSVIPRIQIDAALANLGVGSASITVTSPNGGETLTVGSTHTIKWSSSGSVGNVKIRYSTNNGSSWSNIVSSTANDGAYNWTVPNTVSSKCKIKISEASDGSPSDTSNAVFSIVANGSSTLTVTSPNGGESLEADTTHVIKWSSSGTVGNVKIEYSVNNGGGWTTVASSTANDGAYGWTVPKVDVSQCLVKVSEASDGSPSDTSDAVFSIIDPTPPEISLSRSHLDFGANTGGNVTGGQSLFVGNSGGQTLNWSAASDSSWLSVTPGSNAGSGLLSASVDASGLAIGSYTGTITISDPNATNSPRQVTVNLSVINKSQDQPPFGDFATPVSGSTVYSSIPVTGWVLDDVEVVTVKIYNGPHYFGDATFVDGARPDVEQAYPGYPKNYQAGWGYMLLTNFLPGQGNGTYNIIAKAVDAKGTEVTLGAKTIICDNKNAVKPFGALDTPGQGGTASGNKFINWGWALTPQPKMIPIDGSTIDVVVDGVKIGHPAYNLYRSDIATLLPGYANSDNAVGYFYLDTTGYENGVHTIQWTAKDNQGAGDGIGSRYFTIQNTGGASAASSTSAASSIRKKTIIRGDTLKYLPVDHNTPLRVAKGLAGETGAERIYPGENGMVTVRIEELERIQVHLSGQPLDNHSYSGYMMVGDSVRALPVGSTLDMGKGIFYWQPGPGFLGRYRLVFVQTAANGQMIKKNIIVEILPKTANEDRSGR